MNRSNPYATPSANVSDDSYDSYTPSVLSLRGRIGRLRYLAYSTGISLIVGGIFALIGGAGVAAGMAEGQMPSGPLALVFVLVYIALLVYMIGLGVRRLNDTNHSGWWLLLVFVPIVNFLLTLYLIFASGNEGSNDYGPAPTANPIGVVILGLALPVLGLLGILAAIAIPVMMGGGV